MSLGIPKYFPGAFGAIGIVVYLNQPAYISWSVWMVPGCEDGL